MTNDDRDRIATLMGRMAEGDAAAPFVLYGEFGAVLAGVMRRHLAGVGITAVSREELDGLVIDACLELADCASAWRPDGGALPWTWAGPRLRCLAARYVGIHTDELDVDSLERHGRRAAAGAPSPSAGLEGDDAAALETLDGLAGSHAMAALLREALGQVGSPRDQAIVLELRLQADLGDPSPSHTVGAELAVSPEAVRQASTRVRRHLQALAAADERFAPLATLPLVA